ncbi:MAG TPA: flagellin [Alphaproteobacteria bacterium]
MALNSVHTNTAAIIALQGLNRTNKALADSQKMVSTGYRINDAEDDSAGFAIAQGLRGDVRGYQAIGEQLSKAKGNLSVASEAARSISDAMADVRAVLTKLADDNVTGDQRLQYEADYTNLRNDIERFMGMAEFNGTNLLTDNSSVNVISDLSGGSISITGHDMTTDVYNLLTDVADADAARTLLAGDFQDAMSATGLIMGQLGADSRTLDNQLEFIQLLSDATEEGLGAIVDADLAKESATLQSLQVKQQLATQTLSIANESPQILLSLFRS